MSRNDDKRRFQQSPTSTLRERDPTSPAIANRGAPNMVMDFSQQQRCIPDTLGQTTRYGENDNNFRTTNATGKPFALDVMVGGSPDPRASNKGPRMKQKQELTPTKGR